ncbi:3-phosphoinositide dependent protein kinase-1 [Bonamia ostreae]|uniref:3-phosphoinositide dependent protein kinase-1 n=1 Tax=Bonamia ostreae TaxID=126728 RepID=A0ABV2AN40_9EUKA
MESNPGKHKLSTSDFKIYTVLGNGAYAHVVSARFTSKRPGGRLEHGGMYALKIVSKVKLLIHKKSASVLNEKAALKQLDHKNVVKLYETFQDESSLYFVLELASTTTMADFSRPMHSFSSPNVLRNLFGQVLNALEYIHGKGIVHRDIKPGNILLTERGSVKIADFGCCKLAETDNRNSSGRKSLIGTPAYMAPEIMDSGNDGDFESDLWSLGCTLYNVLLKRQSPFADKNDYLTLKRVKEGSVEYPAKMDADARDLIQKLLRAEPCERLGAREKGGFAALKKHPFFREVDFDNIEEDYSSFMPKHKSVIETFGDFESFVGIFRGRQSRTDFADHVGRKRATDSIIRL